MFDSVHLQNFYERLFRRHLHGECLLLFPDQLLRPTHRMPADIFQHSSHIL